MSLKSVVAGSRPKRQMRARIMTPDPEASLFSDSNSWSVSQLPAEINNNTDTEEKETISASWQEREAVSQNFELFLLCSDKGYKNKPQKQKTWFPSVTFQMCNTKAGDYHLQSWSPSVLWTQAPSAWHARIHEGLATLDGELQLRDGDGSHRPLLSRTHSQRSCPGKGISQQGFCRHQQVTLHTVLLARRTCFCWHPLNLKGSETEDWSETKFRSEQLVWSFARLWYSKNLLWALKAERDQIRMRWGAQPEDTHSPKLTSDLWRRRSSSAGRRCRSPAAAASAPHWGRPSGTGTSPRLQSGFLTTHSVKRNSNGSKSSEGFSFMTEVRLWTTQELQQGFSGVFILFRTTEDVLFHSFWLLVLKL